jgi:hypothetical protein
VLLGTPNETELHFGHNLAMRPLFQFPATIEYSVGNYRSWRN